MPLRDGRVGVVAQTLSSLYWSHRRIDKEMKVRLSDALSALHAKAFVTRFFRESVALTYAVPTSSLSPQNLVSLVDLLDRTEMPGPDADIAIEQPFEKHDVITWPVFQAQNEDVKSEKSPRLGGYVGLCFKAQAKDVNRARFIATEVRAAARVLFQVMQQRARLYQPFARRMSERYWSDATSTSAGDRKKLLLPWEVKNRAVKTVSLGFDLRKSTFCMENAADPARFAGWLDQLVQILMRIGHEYGGVFDKFTGDGGIVHFLCDACWEVDRRSAIEAAVRCAVSMQKAVAIHIERLREFLRFDSELLGGAIGIDLEDAYWDLDHRQNPITVGKGVVGACRLMDKAPAYAVRMTNIGYRNTEKALRQAFSQIPFASKEYPAEMKIRVWELGNALELKWKDQVDVEMICESVYEQDAQDGDGISAILC